MASYMSYIYEEWFEALHVVFMFCAHADVLDFHVILRLFLDFIGSKERR